MSTSRILLTVLFATFNFEGLCMLLNETTTKSASNPFDYVMHYPNELHGMWEGQITQGGSTSCVMLFVQKNGFQFWISYAGYCSYDTRNSLVGLQYKSSGLNMFSEGLVDYNCTGYMEGNLISITSEGFYYCTTFKRELNRLFTTFGPPSCVQDDVQCPLSATSTSPEGALGSASMSLTDEADFADMVPTCIDK
eukprot:TRINITY_DN23799_c1_g1_i3.p4 TRINITY_DN23799_c1_g1~~TRINITY_DN23799_c1_g1_i3.p4  ORF type:complete len:194 (-),score=15.52 TRINITY_DN23799_c1_g1_i3:436-1017(-)